MLSLSILIGCAKFLTTQRAKNLRCIGKVMLKFWFVGLGPSKKQSIKRQNFVKRKRKRGFVKRTVDAAATISI